MDSIITQIGTCRIGNTPQARRANGRFVRLSAVVEVVVVTPQPTERRPAVPVVVPARHARAVCLLMLATVFGLIASPARWALQLLNVPTQNAAAAISSFLARFGDNVQIPNFSAAAYP